MSPAAQQYLMFAVIGAVLVVALFIIWRLSKKRRAPQIPTEEVKPKLELVPEQKKPEAEKPTALKEGLSKTRGGFIARLGGLLGKKQIDKALVDQIEEILFTADIGAKTAAKLLEAVRASLSRNELN